MSLRTGIGWRDESDAEQWEMKIGDRIRIIELPNGLTNDDALQTKDLFERCLGRVFPIAGIVPVKENNTQLLELEVGEVVGEFAAKHSIWIESDLVELVEGAI